MTPRAGAWQRARGEQPLVLGHRGARRSATENTMPAFERAIAEGARGVELDVRLDGSGEVVVLHDRTLERVTGGRDRRAADTLLTSELQRVELAGGGRVPALTEVLRWARNGGHLVNVELKRDVRARIELALRVARTIRAVPDAIEHVLLSSFDPWLVRMTAWLLPEAPSAWLVHEDQRIFREAPAFGVLGATAVHPQLAIASAARIRRWKRGNALVNVWTVNAADDARRLATLGVDAIISDVPGEVVRALAR